jgi:kynurenine formamidase
LNLLTPERRRGGIAEAREGIAFQLSLPLDFPGGSDLAPFRQAPRLFSGKIGEADAYNYPFEHTVPGAYDVMSDDGVILFTQYSTQWDSLAHWGRQFDADGDGIAEIVYYNGFRAGEHITAPDPPRGPYAHRLGVDQMALAGIQGRGVLIDLHAIYGLAPVAVGYEKLMAAIECQGVDVRPGDFMLIHTGFDDLLLGMDRRPDVQRLLSSSAGLDGSDPRLLDWITDSGLVALCADNMAVEVIAGNVSCAEHGTLAPLHEHCLFKLGIHLGELWYLSELTAWLRTHRRSAFLLTAPPLRLPGSVGSPVTPIATV